ncbi:MAG: hypothetical protein JO081_09470 [Alphaproteobacteria bacterium]|nr:hypothetical protein [Alphaproteobacteria bacterium]
MPETPCARALRLDPNRRDPLAHHTVHVNRLARGAYLDIVHFHIDYLHVPMFAPGWGKTGVRAKAALPMSSGGATSAMSRRTIARPMRSCPVVVTR